MNESTKDKAGIWEIIGVIVKWRRLLAINFLAAAIITFLVASFLPKWYASRASIFPPEQESSGLGLASSILGGGLGSMLSGSRMSLPSFVSLSDLYASILRSQVVAENVIKKNNLLEVYDIESMEIGLKLLAGHRTILVEPEGIISIICEDKDPERAAVLVSSFIEELNRVNSEVRVGRAAATRQFIEERLAQTEKELVAAEEDLRAFQLENKTISLNDQVKALINSLAELKTQLILAEIELGVLKRSFLPTHTQVKQKEAEIAEIKKQIKILEEGSPDETQDSQFSIPFSDAPDLGLELVRLTRRLKIQEAVFELLTQQYEQAKIQEKRDTPTVQVLDLPKVPERKSRPKRASMALIAGMLSFFLTLVAVFGKEFVDKNKEADTETYHRLENILETLKIDFYAMRSLFISKKGKSNGQDG